MFSESTFLYTLSLPDSIMPKPGDKVRITTSKETFEGILMPRPDLLTPGITVIKLKSGYNVGIESKKITSIDVIEPYAAKSPVKTASAQDPRLPTVAVISTGGTIVSKIDYYSGAVSADYTAEDFIEMCPELKGIANIRAKKIMGIMSEDMDFSVYEQLAAAIADELKTADGIVVTQGTDTLHFTTAAMSFALQHLNKPVIFTAAQRSIDRGSSDAFMNLICAVQTAAKFKVGIVATCMHGSSDDDACLLIRGTKVRKMHTSRRDAFRPMNENPLAKIWPDGKIEHLNTQYAKSHEKPLELKNQFEPRVALVLIYPGMDPGSIEYYIKKGFKGIVLAATALGHVPTFNPQSSLMQVLDKAAKKKIPVVIASQTLYGAVHPFVYTNLRKLSVERKCIFVHDMLPEVAYIKLAWVLARAQEYAVIKHMMQTSIAGEISERHQPGEFLI